MSETEVSDQELFATELAKIQEERVIILLFGMLGYTLLLSKKCDRYTYLLIYYYYLPMAQSLCDDKAQSISDRKRGNFLQNRIEYQI